MSDSKRFRELLTPERKRKRILVESTEGVVVILRGRNRVELGEFSLGTKGRA